MQPKLIFLLLMMLMPNFASEQSFMHDNNQDSIAAQLSQMSLKEKIGQLFIVAAASNFNQPTETLASSMHNCPYHMDKEHVLKMIREYHVGGVIFLYKSDPATQRAYIQEFQAASKTPLLIVQDAEWGLSMRLDADPARVVRYPRNLTLAAVADEQLIYQLGVEIGQQCAVNGIHLNLAPVVDVNNNPANSVIHDRSFGDDPERVGRLASLYARGLQDAGVIACAKHFPGHGNSSVDSHKALATINRSWQQLNECELVPFKEVIKNGVNAIMTGHIAVPSMHRDTPASCSVQIIGALKRGLHFSGLIINDGLGMDAVRTRFAHPGELELQTVLAGTDMVLCPLDVPAAIGKIELEVACTNIDACGEYNLPAKAIDERVLKILQAKAWAIEQHKKYAAINPDEFLVRPQALELQRKLYSQALTMAKQTRPLDFKQTSIDRIYCLQIGDLENNQLERSLNTKIDYLSASLSDNEILQSFESLKKYEQCMVFLGSMNKFADKNFGISHDIGIFLAALKNSGKSVTVVLFGTPYAISKVTQADNVLVAYEDAPVMQEVVAEFMLGKQGALGTLPVK